MDVKKVIGWVVSAALAAGITFAASKGVEVKCPNVDAPAAQVGK